MIKVYGSVQCPYCMVLKENLDRNQVTYEFIEILANLGNLGAFLELRDGDPVFDHLKKVRDIGVPALVDENEKVWTDWETWLKENNYTVFIPESSLMQTCSMDRKGC